MNNEAGDPGDGSARRAALRRRRIGRALGFGIIAAVIGVFALSGSGDDEADTTKPAAEQSTPEAACEAEAPPPAAPARFDKPPKPALEENIDYRALIETSCGDIAIDLLEDKAPVAVNNFVFLARERFYDGLTWHRVEQNALIQTGDPSGAGTGGPGYTIPDELPASADAYTFGTVGMENTGPDTSGSQFFIVVHDPHPEGGYEPAGFRPDYTVFGRVDLQDEESLNTLEAIWTRPVKGGNDPRIAVQPVVPIFVESVEIIEA